MSKGGKGRKAGLRLRPIGLESTERAEAQAVAEGLEQTARMERARGETVEAADGRLRITSRDGLQSLREHGGLEQPEYEAGMMYRRCYETLAGGPRSNLNRDFLSGVRGFAEAAADGFAELRAMRARRLARWEALARSDRQLSVLRLVAGEGRTINSLASGGSARAANARALTEVLRAVAMERGLRR